MKQFLYIIGQPGAGKTTLMNTVIAKLGSMKIFEAKKPVPHTGYMSKGTKIAVLGKDKKPFGGTDTLSYTAVGTCEEWLDHLPDLVLAEGDRLANERFFVSVKKRYDLTLFHLATPDAESQRRREERAEKYGLSLQSAGWVKGRSTKHKNLAKAFEDTIHLDGAETPEDLADVVLSHIVSIPIH